ncbi:MAG TPA: lipid II flippase MurJ [Bryobacteraceae bacterium]|nr:lipid II flippase MurJ [Bryobacteraceae bacterium]
MRVALTAYLLGTHAQADSLAVAIGPLDAVNSVLINTMVFAFVPMLTARQGAERTALFLKLNQWFSGLFTALTVAAVIAAPWLITILAPGLDPHYHATSVTILRMAAFSIMAAGSAAINCALLYTDRRFAPFAFYQACLNLFTIVGAVSLWHVLGVYGFAIGYSAGAWVQFAIVYFCARTRLEIHGLPQLHVHWREMLGRPLAISLYAVSLALNIVFTRAWATHIGPGMAAALEYCMRGVGVPLAFLVSPISNSLLPEIARLGSQLRLRDAFRLIDRTLGLAALAAVAACGIALALREPAIAILFQRGNFTAESTRLVSTVFLGLAPSLIGWSLLELTGRALFALDRPVVALGASFIPVLVNMALTFALNSPQPQWIGLGSSVGLMVGFLVLFAAAHVRRKHWMQPA